MTKKILYYLFIFCLYSVISYAQTKNITGHVIDGKTGDPLPGVSVVVPGTTIGTVTNIDGIYHLTIDNSVKKLAFTFIGMTKQVVEIGDKNEINVVMKESTLKVGEVVVTALGIKREKKALGYAVQDIHADEIAKTGNANLSTAMQGKLTGIDIKPSSGMPGASTQIVIRGARSFDQNNTPLYVVDGQPIASTADWNTWKSVTGADLSNRAIDINPADIESINVLKGQAAAALYGIRASNGVIIITTKSGSNNKIGKPQVTLSHNSSFDVVSRTPDYQKVYAQGTGGLFDPVNSKSWGPKIKDLPDQPEIGGNLTGHSGKYKVLQRELAGLDPWVTPKAYDNYDDYFRTGYTNTNSISLSQALEKGNYAISLAHTDQEGVALNTGMQRWNAKIAAKHKLNEHFTTGFSANYVKLNIDKLTAGNDASLAGVYAAPASYDLKGIPYHVPGDPFTQIYYRGLTFDNPYWIAKNNTFNEFTERFFGNGYVQYKGHIIDRMSYQIKYQLGIDSYSTHYQNIFGFGVGGGAGKIKNFGNTNATYNSLLTANINYQINDQLDLNLIVGNEIDHTDEKRYRQDGNEFNSGGWQHINNTQKQAVNEEQWETRTVGTFGSLSLAYKSILFLNATGRTDYVSSMPRDNRQFFYPSVSLGFVASELDMIKDISWISFAKLRLSYAEVGQAGRYYEDFYYRPKFTGSWWKNEPITYPISGGTSTYSPYFIKFDPNLKPQNTKSYEIGLNLKFFNNRLGVDYTYSRQDVNDQIFEVPLAGSSGLSSFKTNGGKIHTNSHEINLYANVIKLKDFTYDVNFNYSEIENIVDELREGVESIFLGGYVTPQVRAGIDAPFPVIYGDRFLRNDDEQIVVDDNPNSPTYGMPQMGTPGVIGNVAPDFILGHTSTFNYKQFSLSAVFEWKHGGQMYSGSNGLLDLYGMSKRTQDRESTFIYPGVKSDGTPNDIVRGGSSDKGAYQTLWNNVLGNIDEHYIHDNSFLKLREISLRYNHKNKLFNVFDVGLNCYARNILIWTELENFDPESSQGNNNMGGAFERFSMPQTTSYGFGIDLKF